MSILACASGQYRQEASHAVGHTALALRCKKTQHRAVREAESTRYVSGSSLWTCAGVAASREAGMRLARHAGALLHACVSQRTPKRDTASPSPPPKKMRRTLTAEHVGGGFIVRFKTLFIQMGAWSVNCRDAAVSVKIQYSLRSGFVVLPTPSKFAMKSRHVVRCKSVWL